ncbi:MAG: hypothetical protein ACI8TQ_001232 [Planctomycetota bacterium]|jgi:hypothetical protein
MDNLELLPVEACKQSALEQRNCEKSQAYWNWVFGADGSGARSMSCRGTEGQIIAHVLALRVPALVQGEAAELLHVIEASYDKQATSNSDGPEHFVNLAEQFARTFGGNAPEGAPLLYGLPSRSFWSLAKEKLSAKVMRTQSVLNCSVADLSLPAVGSIEVEVAERFPEEVADLKRQLSTHSEIVCRPTAAALNHRFVDIPECAELESRFQIALVRKAGMLLGYAVASTGGLNSNTLPIWDWCVPESQPAAIVLLDWLKECATAGGFEELRFTLPDTSPDWVSLQQLGFRVYGSNLVLTVRHFPRQMTMRWLYHNWNYSLSDWKLNSVDAAHSS